MASRLRGEAFARLEPYLAYIMKKKWEDSEPEI
jgi:hypothetical protein